MTKAEPIPTNSSAVIPMLVCRNVAAEVDFCKHVFGARELGNRPGPDGTTAHALMTIRDSMIIIEGEWPTIASRAPSPNGDSPVVIFAYVENVDEAVARAVNAGARILMPIKDQFWGDRTARIIDPAQHVWTIATRIEETSSEEREKRWSKIVKE